MGLKADKGNTSVILDRTDDDHLARNIFPEKITKDPTGKIERALTKLCKVTDWPENGKAALTPKASTHSCQKSTKNEGYPLRLTNKISKYLAGLLKTLPGPY